MDLRSFFYKDKIKFMNGIFSRNELLWGKDFQEFLAQKHVVIVGLGGVGGFVAESLGRSGIGELTIVDFDKVSLSNVNRQIIALHSTVGLKKTEVMAERLRNINKNLKINLLDEFYTKALDDTLVSLKPDYIVDAIDTVRSKIDLLIFCHKQGIPVVSSLGVGNRLDPTKLKIENIEILHGMKWNKKCPFVCNVLQKLRKLGVLTGVKCLYSEEKPASKLKLKMEERILDGDNGEVTITKISPGSNPFVPAVCGYLIGYEIVKCMYDFYTPNK